MKTIFTPYQIKGISFKNRIVLPPLVRFSLLGTDGRVNQNLLDWYERIAKTEVGLIIVEATAVEEAGKLRENQLGIWSDDMIEGLSKIVKICHQYETPVLIQLHHAGFKEKISEVSKERLDEILDFFVKAFHRAKEAGFDGIEMHGAHGYLLSQLSSSVWNHRQDCYGNRFYFVKSLIEKTRELFDDRFLLSYRMSGNDPEVEDGIEMAKFLEQMGLDLLHVSNGVPKEVKQAVKISNYPSDFPFHWITFLGIEIKKAVSIPVIAVYGIKTEKQASRLLEEFDVDFVAVGRAMIFYPNWMKKCRKDFEKRMRQKKNENG